MLHQYIYILKNSFTKNMKKIFITEKSEQKLINYILNEEITYLGDKEDIIIKWLNNRYLPMETETTNDMGDPQVSKVVSVLDSKKQPTQKIISLKMVYFRLQAEFSKILQDKKERDMFLWQTLNKWYK